MSETKSRATVLRFAAMARRAIDRGVSRGNAQYEGLIEFLAAGGPALPASERAEELKAAFLSSAADLPRNLALEKAHGKVAPRLRNRALVVGAAAMLVFTVILFSLGFSSTYAMPGNPLYSAKRLVEKARVVLAPSGGSKASAYLTSGNRRLEELEFVCTGNRDDWCYRIAQDAASDIEAAYHEADKTEGKARLEYREKARLAAETLDSLLPAADPFLSPVQKETMKRRMKGLRNKAGSKSGDAEDIQNSNEPSGTGSPELNAPNRHGGIDSHEQGNPNQNHQYQSEPEQNRQK